MNKWLETLCKDLKKISAEDLMKKGDEVIEISASGSGPADPV